MYGLQRLCYGQLRPIEIEQLYEKAWFAITETCLAMTIFREEVGAWFLVMFVALLTGKVWGWIGDGRVEVLEQQPPANPRLFHIRLSASLTMSIIYDLWLMSYTINTVIQQARPNMMVMFLFEFAILTTSSFATACRYFISLVEAKVIKKQTQERLIERRREVRAEREEMIRQREADASTAGESSETATTLPPLPSEDDVDEMDIEVPGWEAKGQWVLSLDLVTDFIKLGIYVTFFIILLVFYGLPIHILRDLFLTARSFSKRLLAFLKYRRATHDMNEKYPDATVEDIQREDTCIICREEMRPWSVTNPPAPPPVAGAPAPPRPTTTINERNRPKKLRCGHILHLGCLKSWLERQQVCPTCRQPVVDGPALPAQNVRAAANNANAPGQGPQQAPVPGQLDGAAQQPPAPAPAPVVRGRGMRMLNFGPLRVGFGQGNLQDFVAPQPAQNNAAGAVPAPNQRVYGLEMGFGRRGQQQQPLQPVAGLTTHELQDHLRRLEDYIAGEIRNYQITQQELQLVQLLQMELARLRVAQAGGVDPLAPQNVHIPQIPFMPGQTGLRTPNTQIATPQPHMQRHGVRPGTIAIPAGSPDLPPGVTIPEGWSLLPLQRVDGPNFQNPNTVSQNASVLTAAATPAYSSANLNSGSAPTATTTSQTPAGEAVSPTTQAQTLDSNNTLITPTPVHASSEPGPNYSNLSSSVHSSDSNNAIHTPPEAVNDPSPSSTLNSSVGNTVEQPVNDDILPNWAGTSRSLFSGLGGASGGSSSGVEREANVTSEGEEQETRRREKGKAKAATVEDVTE
jgi:E3 ubiquitin-protein ligase synoviolin